MILVVNLNPALDITYELTSVHLGQTNRVARVFSQAGGKGINVARILHGLGVSVTLLAPVAGTIGQAIRRELAEIGVGGVWIEVPGKTRRCIAIRDRSTGEITEINESGPGIDEEHWGALQEVFSRTLKGMPMPQRFGSPDDFATIRKDVRCVVLSGSLPPGLPTSAYLVLVGIAQEAGIPVILDTSGDPLWQALPARPDVIKPNQAELAELLGLEGQEVALDRVIKGHGSEKFLEKVQGLGPGITVASFGQGGLVAITPTKAWRAVPPPVQGNPTGAGDAVVASLARGLVEQRPWPEILREAAALSAAAVAEPVAGIVDLARYNTLLPKVAVKELHGEGSR